ncbi:hypothetical protein SNOG_01777 [Parastagonospora nodorum SN15]|uniref:Uncharacterized protein n=1 Tax=Phaeosphaeria nodorum (strain SN15 / ATCC MYA-4574 / FGSC 10173) TaxID=321614 RepID=Q0V2I7_PHANO|nr:hypothetical protein SNOG_01777 [Parastagonospora nodorum SN15]EAT91426.1 hypothetical protein SNOG_01777 [Parastagonospora nodorum SN15]
MWWQCAIYRNHNFHKIVEMSSVAEYMFLGVRVVIQEIPWKEMTAGVA